MRILLINTNTTQAVTQRCLATARAHAGTGTTVEGRTAHFGAAIIATRSEAAISAHALLQIVAEEAGNYDAFVLAMSLDHGLWATRELSPVPVVGMSEAALHVASMHGNRLGLLTFGGTTQTYREMVEAYGFAQKAPVIEALGITPQEHLAEPERVEGVIVDRCNSLAQSGAIDGVILVGAVAAGLPEKLQPRLSVPAFEGISCGVRMAELLVGLDVPKPTLGTFAAPQGRQSIGLSAHLTGRLLGS